MTERRCFGLNKDFSRCKRTGNWLLFCNGHRWKFSIAIVASLIGLYHFVGSSASIYSAYSEFDKEILKKLNISESDLSENLKNVKIEGLNYENSSANFVLTKIITTTSAEKLNDENSRFAMLKNISPVATIDSEYEFDAGDCTITGEVTSFSVENKTTNLEIMEINCVDNSGYVHGIDRVANTYLGFATDSETPINKELLAKKDSDNEYVITRGRNLMVYWDKPLEGMKLKGMSVQKRSKI